MHKISCEVETANLLKKHGRTSLKRQFFYRVVLTLVTGLFQGDINANAFLLKLEFQWKPSQKGGWKTRYQQGRGYLTMGRLPKHVPSKTGASSLLFQNKQWIISGYGKTICWKVMPKPSPKTRPAKLIQSTSKNLHY